MLEFLRRLNIEPLITDNPYLPGGYMPSKQVYVIKKATNFELQIIMKVVPTFSSEHFTYTVSLIVNNSNEMWYYGHGVMTHCLAKQLI